jgi:uncharacterized protein involved in tellurium resistance
MLFFSRSQGIILMKENQQSISTSFSKLESSSEFRNFVFILQLKNENSAFKITRSCFDLVGL